MGENLSGKEDESLPCPFFLREEIIRQEESWVKTEGWKGRNSEMGHMKESFSPRWLGDGKSPCAPLNVSHLCGQIPAVLYVHKSSGEFIHVSENCKSQPT